MDGHRLLLAEPAEAEAAALARQLHEVGYLVDVATNGAQALALAGVNEYACILTEVDLQAISGFELCRRVRASSRTSATCVIFLTRRTDEVDRVVAFEVGADDFVAKPYFARELLLRVKARLNPRECFTAPTPGPLRLGELEVDLARLAVAAGGRDLALTTTEFALFAAIARRGGAVVTRASLLREVWDLPDGQESRTIDTHVRRLREKLGPWGDRLQTVRGVGYRIGPAGSPES